MTRGTTFLMVILTLAIFASGFGVGSFIAAALSHAELDVQTHTTSNRALSFNDVQLAESKERAQPLESTLTRADLVNSGPVERPSPGDWVKESDIEMRPDGVFIKVSNPQWAVLANTNSMDPVFDDGSHLIQIIPTSTDQIRVGDIVSYLSPLGFTIVHRVKEIGHDEEGWYAIMRGDNNPKDDPWKVRWDEVRRVTVMAVY